MLYQRTTTLFIFVALCALLLVSGCGSSSSGSAATPAANGDKTAGAAPAKSGATIKDVVVTDDPDSKAPKETFGTETPKIYIYFGLDGLSTGDKIRGVWICEKSGIAPPNTKIEEATLPTASFMNSGDFALSKPTKGWPEGDYRVDLYINEDLKTSGHFKVAAAK